MFYLPTFPLPLWLRLPNSLAGAMPSCLAGGGAVLLCQT